MDCIIDQCYRKHEAKGYCHKHYLRWYRHGDPNYHPLPNRCIVEGCNGKYSGRGYCEKHYQRFLKYGDPNIIKTDFNHSGKCSRLLCNKPYCCKGLCRKHYTEEYNKLNPRSSGRNGSLEESLAMMNVRIRDNNTCQWYGCNSIENIHVNHIFPVNEHPELKLIERYMICYCKPHHREWHKARGDNYYKMIK